ncbi:MAG: class I poly(R)-hydroxyalkanoic acid synthase [Alphaproteobacteria bacterium]
MASTEKPNPNAQDQTSLPDPDKVSEAMSRIAERSARLVQDFVERQATAAQQQGDNPTGLPNMDPLNIGQAFMEMTARMMSQPQVLMEAQIGLWSDYMKLWQSTTARMLGQESEPVAAPEKGDRRFKHEAWEDNPVFDYIKQSYLLTSRFVQQSVGSVEGLEEKDRQKVDFYTRQFVDAMAPSNFAYTNPAVIEATLESKGENLLKGLENLLEDMEQGKGQLKISMTDTEAFEVGSNIVTTPGKVVYRNRMMELIQYSPTTEKVAKTPLLIIPPWINKYYILDLKAKNSFVKWAVDQGLTVFMISWINPDESHADVGFAEYMHEGPLEALSQIEKQTGQNSANVIGYCLGGTLLASMNAWLADKGQADRIKSATYFTTMVDFADAGELSVFIDEEQISALEARMNSHGYLDASDMSMSFNLLRSNDLIWSFVISNYLMGKEPFPFDLLYWNSDSTRLPAKMHSFYLRNCYLDNALVQPGAVELDGVKIDLGKVEVPTFILSTREDHIAPWKSTYKATQIYKGPVKFVLAGSGHIAGVVNPPEANKYGYWTNSTRPADPDRWLEKAKQSEGSWWPEWRKWLSKHDGGKTDARDPASGTLEPITDAPGTYVKIRA